MKYLNKGRIEHDVRNFEPICSHLNRPDQSPANFSNITSWLTNITGTVKYAKRSLRYILLGGIENILAIWEFIWCCWNIGIGSICNSQAPLNSFKERPDVVSTLLIIRTDNTL